MIKFQEMRELIFPYKEVGWGSLALLFDLINDLRLINCYKFLMRWFSDWIVALLSQLPLGRGTEKYAHFIVYAKLAYLWFFHTWLPFRKEAKVGQKSWFCNVLFLGFWTEGVIYGIQKRLGLLEWILDITFFSTFFRDKKEAQGGVALWQSPVTCRAENRMVLLTAGSVHVDEIKLTNGLAKHKYFVFKQLFTHYLFLKKSSLMSVRIYRPL